MFKYQRILSFYELEKLTVSDIGMFMHHKIQKAQINISNFRKHDH